MLAETLREWEERLVSEGRRTGREEERALLRRLAEQRFDAKTVAALALLLADAESASAKPEGQ